MFLAFLTGSTPLPHCPGAFRTQFHLTSNALVEEYSVAQKVRCDGAAGGE